MPKTDMKKKTIASSSVPPKSVADKLAKVSSAQRKLLKNPAGIKATSQFLRLKPLKPSSGTIKAKG